MADRPTADVPGPDGDEAFEEAEQRAAARDYPERLPDVDGVSLGDREQTLTDADQTSADLDQTSADLDQTGADLDQISADRDQWASDLDQDASDRDVVAGVDPGVHDVTTEIRRRGREQRALSARARLDAANLRDEAARARDLAALARDQDAAARDLLMAARDEADAGFDDARAITGAEVVVRAAGARRRAADRRAQAAEHRAFAAADRDAMVQERVLNAHEREAARADREDLARQLEIAETDSLTGARSRAAGLRDLEHEIARCRRTNNGLVVAYVDVVGLKALNDARGHAAGDALLQRVVTAIRSQPPPPHGLVIRLGGDEFLCATSQITLVDARKRFAQLAATLSGAADDPAIRTGFAELRPDDDAAALIARADHELTASRTGSC